MKKKFTVKKIILALFGIFFVGTGIALNSLSALGNDAIAVMYDGFRVLFNLDMDKLGFVSNAINIIMVIVVLFVARYHINIGTVIYTFVLGFVITFMTKIYLILNIPFNIYTQILLAIFGCSLLYIGVGLYIAVDIGLDPATAFVMMIADKVKINFSKCKIMFDFTSIIIFGLIMGGKIGILTIITATTAGVSIQFFSEKFKKLIN